MSPLKNFMVNNTQKDLSFTTLFEKGNVIEVDKPMSTIKQDDENSSDKSHDIETPKKQRILEMPSYSSDNSPNHNKKGIQMIQLKAPYNFMMAPARIQIEPNNFEMNQSNETLQIPILEANISDDENHQIDMRVIQNATPDLSNNEIEN